MRTIRIISQSDLITAGCFNIPEAVCEVEKAFYKYAQNKIIFPDKVSVIFDEASQNRINCLPAAVLDENVYGMKWVSVFPENPYLYNLPNLSAVILLSELKYGYPKTFMEGKLCSNLRTAATSAVAAKYLASDNTEVIGFIGAGEQAKTHLMALLYVCPNIKICKVASRTLKSERKFIEQMRNFYPELKFVACNSSYQIAAEQSDIIVTAISGQEKLLRGEWIKPGALYCHVGGLEDDYSVVQKADKIVCDDWSVVKHRTQTISRMFKEGLLSDDNIYANLWEIVSRKKSGRENDSEFIYFNTVGMSYVDIQLANYMYKKVVDAGLGKDIELANGSMFDVDFHKIELGFPR